jgi:hypothetical protein
MLLQCLADNLFVQITETAVPSPARRAMILARVPADRIKLRRLQFAEKSFVSGKQ